MKTPKGASERSGAPIRARLTGVGQGDAYCSPQWAAQERLLKLFVGFPHPMLT
jgi:hypothetical protein